MGREALLTLPDGVLRLPADTVGIFFFFWDVTSLLWRVDRALIKASSSCLSMTVRQGSISVESVLFTAVAAATVALIAQWISQSIPQPFRLIPMKTAHGKRNFMREATPSRSDNQPMEDH